jgi:hypothetical protein
MPEYSGSSPKGRWSSSDWPEGRVTQTTESDPTADVRKIPVWAFIALAIVYLAILLALIRLLTPALDVEAPGAHPRAR